MRCDECRELISAHADGEVGPEAWARALPHLRECGDCREYQVETERLRRFTRLRAAEPVPDLTPQILAAAGLRPAPSPVGTDEQSLGVRVVLACTGLLQIALATPALLLGDDAHLPVHVARHIGSFDVALAIGFLWVAWRPRQAVAGVLPIAVALVVCLLGTSIADVASHRATPSGELQHVTDLVGLTALWLLHRIVHDDGNRNPRTGRRPHLRHVAG
jgi:predicted anti-sigma-YlaC factor YlaD